MNDLAPIVLFVYNRPWHTKKTLDALAKNELANASELYVFCDGPKQGARSEVLNSISETRTIAKNENRFEKLTVIEAPLNKGLAKSIIEGVTEIVNKYGKIIVLEDDIVTSPGFLNYMNDALDLYQKEDKVMHVSGYMYPVKKELPETFFIRPTSCWGWATWSNRWKFFDRNPKALFNRMDEASRKKFDLNGTNEFWPQITKNMTGEINTWAIFWYAEIFLRGGLCVSPSQSYTGNIGFDGSGTNCVDEYNLQHSLLQLNLNQEIDFDVPLEENLLAISRIRSIYTLRKNILSRIFNKLKTFMPWL